MGVSTDSRGYRDEETLRRLYLEEELTTYEIADLYEVSRPTISNWLEEFGVPRRGDHTLSDEDEEKRTKEYFRRLYVEEQLSCPEIADIIGLDSREGVRYWLEKHGIERRQPEIPIDESELRSMYVDESMTIYQIAPLVDRSPSSVKRWLHSYDIETDPAYGWGTVCETENGEIVRSKLEKDVADWLHYHDVEYVYEPEVDSVRWTPDFCVSGTIVEVWGLAGSNDQYDQKMQQKKSDYDDVGIDFVSLYPDENFNLDLSEKLSQFC
jgi:transposase